MKQLYQQLTIAQLWAAVSTVLLALMAFAKFFKDVFGIEAFGRKVYKGFPLIWKFFWRNAIFRKDTETKLDFIVAELKYNGGSSTKDALKRNEMLLKENTDALIRLQKRFDMGSSRMDIADLANNRMTFRVDGNGACIEINEVFLKTFGYNEKDVLGYGFESIVHEDDVMEMRSKWGRAIEQCNRFYDEQRIFDSKRREHLCCVRGFPICSDGKVIEFIGYIEFMKKATI